MARTRPVTLLAVEPNAEEAATVATLLDVDRDWIEYIATVRQPSVRRWGSLVVADLQEVRFFEELGMVDSAPFALVLAPEAVVLVARDSKSKIVADLLRSPPIDIPASDSGMAAGVLLLVLDSITEQHLTVLYELEGFIEEVEDLLWGQTGAPAGGMQVWKTRREVSFHNARLSGALDAMERLTSFRLPIMDSLSASADELIDQMRRAKNQSDLVKSTMSELFETFYAEQSRRLSESSRRLSTALALVGVPATLTGLISLYPGEIGTIAYVLIVVALLGVALVMYRIFKRRMWL